MSEDSIRLDKWLWHARFCKTRSVANALCGAGRIRISGRRIIKPHQPVRVGDVLTIPLGGRIRVVRVRALSERRASTPEARSLYDDLIADAATAASAVPGRAVQFRWINRPDPMYKTGRSINRGSDTS